MKSQFNLDTGTKVKADPPPFSRYCRLYKTVQITPLHTHTHPPPPSSLPVPPAAWVWVSSSFPDKVAVVGEGPESSQDPYCARTP